MSYRVMMFGHNWGADQTNDLCAEVEIGQQRPDDESWTLMAEHRSWLKYDELSDAQLTADELWEVFWNTRNDNYRDDNPSAEWQFVVAVFREDDVTMQHPVYTRGYQFSKEAPWMFWAKVERPNATT